eukprot:TRINITY_DN2151_c0_g1_i1.p1 TRINITY_DN2151_c0_g1~~TRINITY_DN2151_c0_g1_i1.p1  ORF type:complete len:625 (-),score=191.65 TRINITY_DN2151_c0_g1_i1:31-1905(-)
MGAKELAKAMGIKIKEIVRRMNITSPTPLNIKNNRTLVFSSEAITRFVKHFKMIPDYVEYDLIRDRKASLISDQSKLRTKRNRRPIVHTKPKIDPRPGIISVMGHVDHGKTTLLDALRNTSVAASEAGGITQKLSAFGVVSPVQNQKITFLDTPGHSAFFRMRRNGAFVSDLIYLIIALDEGICSQTKESFALAVVNKIPMIILINKIDLIPDQDQVSSKIENLKNEIKKELARKEEREGLIKQIVPISAKFKVNLDVLEAKTLESLKDLNLVADSNCLGEATVIESFLNSRGVGVVILVVVHVGKLKVGDYFISGYNVGRITSIYRAGTRQQIQQANPSDAVEIVGLKSFTKKDKGKNSSIPSSGESMFVVSKDKVLEVQAYRALVDQFESSEGKWDKLLLQSIQNDIDFPNGLPRKKKRKPDREKEVKDDEDEEEEDEDEDEDEEEEEEEEKENDEEEEEEEEVDKESEREKERREREKRWEQEEEEEKKEYKMVLKADNLGSLHAIGDGLTDLSDENVKMEVVHAGVGNIIQKDLQMAQMFECDVWAFNVGTEVGLKAQEGVEIRFHNVHYELMSDLRVQKEIFRRELARQKEREEGDENVEEEEQTVDGEVVESKEQDKS